MTDIVILVTGYPTSAVARIGGDFADMVRRAAQWPTDVGVSVCDVQRGTLPPLDRIDGIIVTGSPHSVTERLPWMLALESYVREAVATDRHVLGLCFGHQLIASALGGEVVRNPRGLEVGMVTAHALASDDALGFPSGAFAAFMVHEDTVSRPPPGSVVLAKTSRDAHAAIRFAPRCWGVQFHPEFSGEVVRAYIAHERAQLSAQGDDPEVLLAQVGEADEAAGLLRRFVRLPPAPPPAR